MNTQTEYLTQEKFDALKAELEMLKTVKRKEIAETLEYAKSLGDLSENQEYQEARNTQAVVEDRIQRLDAMLKNASIVSTHDTSSVTVGSCIVVEKESDKSRREFVLVGSEEADASQGKISVHSPLGAAAIDKAKGDTFSFETPGGEMRYRVVDIK